MLGRLAMSVPEGECQQDTKVQSCPHGAALWKNGLQACCLMHMSPSTFRAQNQRLQSIYNHDRCLFMGPLSCAINYHLVLRESLVKIDLHSHEHTCTAVVLLTNLTLLLKYMSILHETSSYQLQI